MNALDRRTPRAFLAKEIQRMRVAVGMDRAQLAKAVFVSEALVRSWERAIRLIQPDHLKKIETLAGTDRLKGILERLREEYVKQGPSPEGLAAWSALEDEARGLLAIQDKVQGILSRMRAELIKSGMPLEWFGEWPEIEAKATSLWWLELNVIPGLLQTPEYAHVVLKAAKVFAELASEVDDMVQARLKRQQVLSKEDAPTFVALIAESALRNNVGGAEVMHAQLMHLVEVAQHDHIVVQVIKARSPICAGFGGPLIVASFDGSSERSDNGSEAAAAYLDNALAGDVIEDIEEVARARRMFDIFRGEALSKSESIKFIRKVAAEWEAEAEKEAMET